MDSINSLLDQIARLEAQNRVESDRDLRRENKATIKALHKQVRKAARYRHPWHGLIRNVVGLFLVFFAALFALLLLARSFGLKSMLSASVILALVFTLIVSTILLITRHINQDTFRNLVQICVDSFGTVFSGTKEKPSGEKPSVPVTERDTPPALPESKKKLTE